MLQKNFRIASMFPSMERNRKEFQKALKEYADSVNASGKQVYEFIKPLKAHIGGGVRITGINEGPFKKGDTVVSVPNLKIDWKNNELTYATLKGSEGLVDGVYKPVYVTVKASKYVRPTSKPYVAVDYSERIKAKKESAGLVVIFKDQIFLVHPTGAEPNGTCSIPKGKLEPGEMPWAAAIIEFEEETGLKLKVKIYEDTPFFTINTPIRNLHFFVAEVDSYADLGMRGPIVDKSKLQAAEVDWAGFVPFTEAYDKMSPYQLPILQIAQNYTKLKPSKVVLTWENEKGRYNYTLKEAGQAEAFASGQKLTKPELTKQLNDNGVPEPIHNTVFSSTNTAGEVPIVYPQTKNYTPPAVVSTNNYKYVVALWISIPVFAGLAVWATCGTTTK